MAFDRLVGIRRRAECHQLARPGRPAELARQYLDEVGFHQDDRGELIAGIQLELPMVASREAGVAPVRAAAVRVE